MTWTITERGNAAINTSSGGATIASFTSTSGNLLVLGYVSDSTGITSISGHGTWSRHHVSSTLYSGGQEVELWACLSTGATATVVITAGYSANASMQCIEISETAGFPAAVADCFGTGSDVGGYIAGAQTVSPALSAFGETTHLTLVFPSHKFAGYGLDEFSPDTGYTETTEYDGSGTVHTVAFHYKESEDTTPSVTYAHSYLQGHVGIEVKHAAGAPAGDNTTIIIPTGPALS